MELELSIIVPMNDGDLERFTACITGIAQNTSGYEVIVVAQSKDNAFHDSVDSIVRSNMKVIHSRDSLAYTDLCNRGLKSASGRHICVLHPAAVPGIRWAQVMLNELKNPIIGLVGPQMLHDDSGFGFIVNWCYVIKRDVLDFIGELKGDIRLSKEVLDRFYAVVQVNINMRHCAKRVIEYAPDANTKLLLHIEEEEHVEEEYLGEEGPVGEPSIPVQEVQLEELPSEPVKFAPVKKKRHRSKRRS